MKKLITLVLSLLLVFQLCPAVLADGGSSGGLCIMAPLDGSTVPCTFQTFEARLPEDKNAVSTLYFLDGEYIGDGGASAIVTTDKELYYGKHTIELRAIYEDGTGERTVSQFTANLPQYVMDFEKYPSKVYEVHKNEGDEGFQEELAAVHKDVKNDIDCLHDINSNLFKYGTFEIGTDPQMGKVAKMNKTKGGTLYAGNGALFVPALYENGTPVQKKEGRLVIEFDFSFGMGTNWASVLQVAPHSKNGHNKLGLNLIHNSGVIPGTGKTLNDTLWHHAKAIFDLDTGRYNAWVDDIELPEGDILFPDSIHERDYYYYRIGVAMSRAGDFFAVDNILVGCDGAMGDFSGITDVDYVNGMGETVGEDGALVSRDVQKIILTTDRALNIDSVTESNISVKLGGETVDITELLLSDDGYLVTLTLDNPGVSGNGESSVTLSENIQLSDGAKIGRRAVANLSLEPKGFLVKSVDWRKGESELFSSAMLRDGDVIKADISFQNVSENIESLTAVLVVKDGDKYISLTAEDVKVEITDGTDYIVTLTAPTISDVSDPNVYLMLIDDLNSGLYIDSYDLP